MQLSIIIVNYNVRDLLLNAIASLYRALDGIQGEIIVVDNASTDDAITAIGEEYPEVETIQLERNIGFGRANNVGIERSSGRYILLINPDTIVEEDTLRTMITFMEEHPNAGVAGCRILNPDGSLEPASKRGFPSPWSSFCRVFGLSKLFPKSKLFGGYNLTWLDPDDTSTIEALSGCFMFFRGDVLRDLNGFDPDFFMYGEDLDLCYRVRCAHWEVWYHPETSIIHLKGESTRRSSLDSIAMFYDAMEIFSRKHFKSNRLLLWLVRLGIALRRGAARFASRFPRIEFVLIDTIAVLIGGTIGTIMKFGGIRYPDYAFPAVVIVPPVVFILSLGIAGSYGPRFAKLSRTLLGYLLGFFVLSTLPYFFEDYRFSRGVVLATTGIATVIGLSVRFIFLLYQRVYGSEAARRVAFITREEVDHELRDKARRMFLGRPVNVVGSIAPTFAILDTIEGKGLGTIENIGRIVNEHRLTDILVVDSGLSYGEVIKAIRLAANKSVRFHVVRPNDEEVSDGIEFAGLRLEDNEHYRTKTGYAKRVRDTLLAVALTLFGMPVLYLSGRGKKVALPQLFRAMVGRIPLVGGAIVEGDPKQPVFSAASLYQDEQLSRGELAEIDHHYNANQTLLLDCEIILASLKGVKGSGRR